eukprot:CAMPEP_0177656104 /NCGR_PEP_ID=MMETSP0447-20121125/15359_1 /TAXON_ID=0 /ORGANISM="Stygamoeba regulata, Strain BSH-02190019" /LENGTH=441 /DNA_ID=CAMNT_0019160141 /DNA_START=1 /DNA_END=1326 /DNA_ORIENTATION=+
MRRAPAPALRALRATAATAARPAALRACTHSYSARRPHPPIRAATIDADGALAVQFDVAEGEEGCARWWPAWVDDNAQAAFHPSTRQRTRPVHATRRPLLLEAAEADADGACVRVRVCPQGDDAGEASTPPHTHTALLPAAFLWANRPAAAAAANAADPPHQPWAVADLPGLAPPAFPLAGVLADDALLLSLLTALTRLGVARLTDCGSEPEVVARVLARIGFARHTNYGTTFDVRVEPDAVNQAYTDIALPLHTDLPFYREPPGVQLLHCICQDAGGGGESLLVDGLSVACAIREESPELYHVLTTTPVRFEDGKGRMYAYTYDRCTIEEAQTPQGLQPRRVFFNNGVRGSTPFTADRASLDRLYAALRMFDDVANRPALCWQRRLLSGDALMFDNTRVLHGRTAIAAARGARWLRGGYVDWDEVRSKATFLALKAGGAA